MIISSNETSPECHSGREVAMMHLLPAIQFLKMTPLQVSGLADKVLEDTSRLSSRFLVTATCADAFRKMGRRCFGVQRVVQKRRHQMRILQPKQDPYKYQGTEYSGDGRGTGPGPLPLSLVNSGPVKKLIYSGSAASIAAARAIDWDQYRSPCVGVRWHPSGAWRVQFDRRCVARNFFVSADLYFRVGLYGFAGAKQRAVQYRRRLEAEWKELQQTWHNLDASEARNRASLRPNKEEIAKPATETPPQKLEASSVADTQRVEFLG